MTYTTRVVAKKIFKVFDNGVRPGGGTSYDKMSEEEKFYVYTQDFARLHLSVSSIDRILLVLSFFLYSIKRTNDCLTSIK